MDPRNLTISLTGAGGTAGSSPYLLVVEGGSASIFPIASDGELLIGRAPEAQLRLNDNGCSRRHAQLTVVGGSVQVVDLGSHNGTRVNGAPIREVQPLASGDVIAIGEVTIVLHCASRPAAERSLLDAGAFRQRLEQEVGRAVRYERAFTLLWLSLGNTSAAAVAAVLDRELRILDVVGRERNSELFILLPELQPSVGLAAAARLVDALRPLAPSVRLGAASCPRDGCRADTLLAAARSAGSAAADGVKEAIDCVTRIQFGSASAVVADPAMIQVYELLRRLAASDLSVLVLGETGAGKENAAQALHHWSHRAQRPLVSINCASMPDTLLESELFGYEKGAFSGASATKVGILEAANGGTVFLDEVGELSLAAQAKLLRAFETRRIQRLGSLKEQAIDVRLVAATNRDLEAEIKAGRFRQDLFFRLGAAKVSLPPLRDRPRDVTLLARLFLDEASAPMGRTMSLSAAAMDALLSYPWPGNVRELKNQMQYLAATVSDAVVGPWQLAGQIVGAGAQTTVDAAPAAGGEAAASFRPLADEIRELERTRMEQALDATGGVQTRAADLISMPLRTFRMKLKQLGLGQPRSG